MKAIVTDTGKEIEVEPYYLYGRIVAYVTDNLGEKYAYLPDELKVIVKDDKDNVSGIIKQCERLQEELKEMERCREFLIETYHTHKGWFKTEGGRVTTEDVIKSSFDFGWSARGNFDYKNK